MSFIGKYGDHLDMHTKKGQVAALDQYGLFSLEFVARTRTCDLKAAQS